MPFDNPQPQRTHYESDRTKLLRAAFALIDKEENWNKGANEVAWVVPNGDGTPKVRYKYCAQGALMKAAATYMGPPPHAVYRWLQRYIPSGSSCPVPSYNDAINHNQLCAWWIKAIDESVRDDLRQSGVHATVSPRFVAYVV